MPEDNEKVSIEKLITGEDKLGREDKIEKPTPSDRERESIPDENSNFEGGLDSVIEKNEENESNKGESEIGGIVKAGNTQNQKTQQIKNIEEIMSLDLKDAYLSMSKEKRIEFKKIGEETAVKINELLEKTKVKIKKIIRLLRKWLSLIPGANKYFLEQKVKIKADEIMALKNNENK